MELGKKHELNFPKKIEQTIYFRERVWYMFSEPEKAAKHIPELTVLNRKSGGGGGCNNDQEDSLRMPDEEKL